MLRTPTGSNAGRQHSERPTSPPRTHHQRCHEPRPVHGRSDLVKATIQAGAEADHVHARWASPSLRRAYRALPGPRDVEPQQLHVQTPKTRAKRRAREEGRGLGECGRAKSRQFSYLCFLQQRCVQLDGGTLASKRSSAGIQERAAVE